MKVDHSICQNTNEILMEDALIQGSQVALLKKGYPFLKGIYPFCALF